MRLGSPREMLRWLWSALCSRTASFWVMGAWLALAVVWLAPFQFTGQPQATIDGIVSDWLPFRVSWAALLAFTFACGLARLVRDVRRARRPLRIDRPLPSEPATTLSASLEEAALALENARFEVARAEDRVVGMRRRWSLLGGSLFHLALPLLAAGLLAHALTYGSIEFRLIEGQSADHVTGSVAAGSGRWNGLASATASMTLEKVTPAFYRDVLLFERLDATVVEERTGHRRDMSLSSPLWLDPFTTLAIQDFGYAPDVQLLDAKGNVLEEVVAAMNVFPPGSQDRLRIPVNGYTVSMVVYPDHGVVGGRDVSLSFNLRNPKVLVGVEQDYPEGVTRARALVELGEPVTGADLPVRVKDLRRYGSFRVSRSYGWPVVAVSALLMLAGLVSRVLFPRQEVVVWRHGEGLGMTGRVDGRPGPRDRAAFLSQVAALVTAASGSDRPGDAE